MCAGELLPGAKYKESGQEYFIGSIFGETLLWQVARGMRRSVRWWWKSKRNQSSVENTYRIMDLSESGGIVLGLCHPLRKLASGLGLGSEYRSANPSSNSRFHDFDSNTLEGVRREPGATRAVLRSLHSQQYAEWRLIVGRAAD